MVVPVDVALGRGTPAACRAIFRLWLLKSKPGIVGGGGGRCEVVSGYVVMVVVVVVVVVLEDVTVGGVWSVEAAGDDEAQSRASQLTGSDISRGTSECNDTPTLDRFTATATSPRTCERLSEQSASVTTTASIGNPPVVPSVYNINLNCDFVSSVPQVPGPRRGQPLAPTRYQLFGTVK
jgi:hypothetical protein